MHIHIRRTVCVHLAILVGCLTLPLGAYCQSNDPPVELVLQAARPLQVALDARVTAHHVGQRVTGTLVQPVYVYDRVGAAGRLAVVQDISIGSSRRRHAAD